MAGKTNYAFLCIVCAMWLWPASCKKAGEPALPTGSSQDHRHYSFLALGDSYTIGQSVDEEDRFPAQTRAMLSATGKQVDRLVYVAKTGWTTIDLQNAIDQQKPQGPFDLVTLLIGVNDQGQFHDTAGYSQRFNRLLESVIALAGNKASQVFVLSIPDYSVTPLGAVDDTIEVRRRIAIFNGINATVSNSHATRFIDITPVSKEALHDASLIANDSLHFSGKMYRKWAELLAPEMTGVLK